MADPYEVLRDFLTDRVIAFHPQLARAFGGINEALFFQQIAYWSGKGADPDWIYKTRDEIAAETCLSRYQQEQARKALIKLGVLEEERRGVPAKLFYRINWAGLFTLLGVASKPVRNSPTRRRETDQQDGRKRTNQRVRKSPTTTKSTAKRPPKRSSEIFEVRNSNGLHVPKTPEEVDAWEEENRRLKKLARALEPQN